MGKTLAECRTFAAAVCKAFPTSYCAATIPYAVYRSGPIDTQGRPWPWPNAPDVTIPFEIMKLIGIELRLVYKDQIEYIGKR